MNDEEIVANDSEDSTEDSEILLDSEGLHNGSDDGALSEDQSAEDIGFDESVDEALEYTVVLNEDQYNELLDLFSFGDICIGILLGVVIGIVFFMGLSK